MERQLKYVVEGNLKSMGKVDFGKAKLAVHAFIDGVDIARADVDKKGCFKLTFDYGEKPPATELRVIPARFSERCSRSVTLSKTFSPMRYVMKKKSPEYFYAEVEMAFPEYYLWRWARITKTYHMQGTVYAKKESGGVLISVESLPGARIEFYEVDHAIWVINPEITETYLGYAYTGPDGSYTFDFDFSYGNSPYVMPGIGSMWLYPDRIPDIRARISQFEDGIWKQVYEGPVDWDIVENFHRDYFVPVEDAIPIPDSGVKPTEGFRFTSVGLLPIDTTRIVKGYATAQSGDPSRIAGISHQPFCGTLRIFGLFADAPPVVSYKVQIAEADENGAIGSWHDVTDPLHNREWNGTNYEHRVLGPDSATGLYQNIDTQPEGDWHEHALKYTWNSANEPNGYYALRIISYDAADSVIGTYEMPVMRIDNDRPEASIEAVSPPVLDCGNLTLGTDRKITFRITAHDPEGHVLSFSVSGTRGRDAHSAGAAIVEIRPDTGDIWTGIENQLRDFTVSSLPGELIAAGCTSVSYNFELHVYGLATDCYSVTPGAQRVKRETNLIVSEP